MILVDHTFECDPIVFAHNNLRAKQASRFGKRWCHMWSSNNNIFELIEFAKRLGLRSSYLQSKDKFPHFDLIPSKRARAVKLGAVEVSLKEWAEGKIPGNDAC